MRHDGCDRAHWRKRRKLPRVLAQIESTENQIDLLLFALSVAVLGQLDELLRLLVILLSLASAAAGTSHCEVGVWVCKKTFRVVCGVGSEESGKNRERETERERGRE